ncbi:MAG: hypothetical protein FJ279_22375 [Planctomycetes bacterium]|nr:hypothetical protein [Planctomycetota bacterium]
MNPLKLAFITTSAAHFPVVEARKRMAEAEAMLRGLDVALLGPELVITSQDAEATARKLRREAPDALLLLIGAFTLDNIPARITQELPGVPLILWAMPEPPMEGGKLSTNSLCGGIMNNATLRKLGLKPKFIYGARGEDRVLTPLKRHLLALCAASALRTTRFGLVGYRTSGFYNSTFDEIAVRRQFGVETIHLDLLELVEGARQIPDHDVAPEVAATKVKWKLGDATERDLFNSVKLYRVLKDFAQREGVNAIGVKCWPDLHKRGLSVCAVLGWLTDDGLMAPCEADFWGAMTMVLGHALTRAAPFFADLIHLDEKANTGVFWHCGAAPPSLASCPSAITLQKQFRGPERSTAGEFPLRPGRVTIARFGLTDGQPRMFIATGEALPTQMILRGNPLTVRLDKPISAVLDTIVAHGVEHHYTLLYGDLEPELRETCEVLGIAVLTPP